MVIACRIALSSNDGIKVYNPDGSSDRKQNMLAECLYWQHLDGSTKTAVLGVRPIYRETAEELTQRALERFDILEASARTALPLMHRAQHGTDMPYDQVEALAGLAGLHGLVATMGDRAANETRLNLLLADIMGHTVGRLVCSMHATDNGAKLTLQLDEMFKLIEDDLKRLADLHGVQVSDLFGKPMQTVLERALEKVANLNQYGAKKAAELLSFTMGSRVDARDAILKNKFNLMQEREEVAVRCSSTHHAWQCGRVSCALPS